MKTVSMTEFNQHPSRIARLAAEGEVVVLRRGKPVLRILGVESDEQADPLDEMIRLGLARPPVAEARRTERFPSVDTDLDLGSMLDEDRGRLDG